MGRPALLTYRGRIWSRLIFLDLNKGGGEGRSPSSHVSLSPLARKRRREKDTCLPLSSHASGGGKGFLVLRLEGKKSGLGFKGCAMVCSSFVGWGRRQRKFISNLGGKRGRVRKDLPY